MLSYIEPSRQAAVTFAKSHLIIIICKDKSFIIYIFSKIVDRTSMLKENILVDLTQLFKVHFLCPCVVSQGENVLDFLWKSCGLSGLGDSAVPNLRHNKQIIKD